MLQRAACHPGARPAAAPPPLRQHGASACARRAQPPSFAAASTSAPRSSSASRQEEEEEEEQLPLHARLMNYKMQTQLDGGTLLIQPLKVEMLQRCADMLTLAFVDTDAVRMQAYSRFLRRQVSEYLEQHIVMMPRTLILAATWVPAAAEDSDEPRPSSSSGAEAEAAASHDSLEGGSPCNSSDNHAAPQLIGTAEISLDASTRTKFWTLNSPDSAGYLSNMTVLPDHRRRGVAKLLIDAVEELCLMSGQQDVYLHARLQDKPALALYRKAGFSAVAEDKWFVQWLGLDRRYLMKKTLAAESMQR